MKDHVVFVDEMDREIGTGPKFQAHVDGRLHRAVSVFLFNQADQLLLQRRAPGKYHSGGRWSNTCCTHPWPGEDVAAAARRRLYEEMRIHCPLERIGGLVYRAPVADALIEHEYDHLFVGRYEGDPTPDPDEVDDWTWTSWRDLREDMAGRPDVYTPWLAILMNEVGRALGLE